MDRVSEIDKRIVYQDCETDRNARQVLAKAYQRLTRQSDVDAAAALGEQTLEVPQPDMQEVAP